MLTLTWSVFSTRPHLRAALDASASTSPLCCPIGTSPHPVAHPFSALGATGDIVAGMENSREVRGSRQSSPCPQYLSSCVFVSSLNQGVVRALREEGQIEELQQRGDPLSARSTGQPGGNQH